MKKVAEFRRRGRQCQPPTHPMCPGGTVGNWHRLFPDSVIFMPCQFNHNLRFKIAKWSNLLGSEVLYCFFDEFFNPAAQSKSKADIRAGDPRIGAIVDTGVVDPPIASYG